MAHLSSVSGHLHPNRVYVNELPMDVTKEELEQAFSEFKVNIRYIRIVQTRGSTNYGFITLESKEEADKMINIGRSDGGILIRGTKVPVNHAYSRRAPPRRNSKLFSAALQNICRAANGSASAAGLANQQFLPSGYEFAFATANNQRYAAAAAGASNAAMNFPMQAPQSYASYVPLSFWSSHGGRPYYLTSGSHPMTALPESQAVSQTGHMQFSSQYSPVSTHAETQSTTQWPMHRGGHQHFPVDQMDISQSHVGGALLPLIGTRYPRTHLNPMFVHEPMEGLEAPAVSQWTSVEGSATGRQQLVQQHATGFNNGRSQTYLHQIQPHCQAQASLPRPQDHSLQQGHQQHHEQVHQHQRHRHHQQHHKQQHEQQQQLEQQLEQQHEQQQQHQQ